MRKIYLASPFGFSEAGREFMYNKIIPAIEKTGFEIIDPWKLTPEAEDIPVLSSFPVDNDDLKKIKNINLLIGKNNIIGLQECDAVFAVLDGVDMDSGTASEIGFAAALNKPIIGYRSDFRMASDNLGSSINIQVAAFIELSGGTMISALEKIEQALNTIK